MPLNIPILTESIVGIHDLLEGYVPYKAKLIASQHWVTIHAVLPLGTSRKTAQAWYVLAWYDPSVTQTGPLLQVLVRMLQSNCIFEKVIITTPNYLAVSTESLLIMLFVGHVWAYEEVYKKSGNGRHMECFYFAASKLAEIS